jgi:hypothetical protein
VVARAPGQDRQGYTLASLARDGSVLAFALDRLVHVGGADPATAKPLVRSDRPVGDRARLLSMQLRPDGGAIAWVADSDGEAPPRLSIADLPSGSVVHEAVAPPSHPLWFGDRLVEARVAGARTTLCDVRDPGCAQPVLVVPRPIGRPVLSPDGRTFAATILRDGASRTVALFSATSGRLLRPIWPQVFEVDGPVAWSPDGASVVVGTSAGVHTVDVRTGVDQRLAGDVGVAGWAGRIGSRNPRLRLAVRVRRGRVLVTGRLRRGVRAPVRVTFEAPEGSMVWGSRVLVPRRGRFSARFPLWGSGVTHRSACRIIATATGDVRFRRSSVRRPVVAGGCVADP